jgi:hypothetical protein
MGGSVVKKTILFERSSDGPFWPTGNEEAEIGGAVFCDDLQRMEEFRLVVLVNALVQSVHEYHGRDPPEMIHTDISKGSDNQDFCLGPEGSAEDQGVTLRCMPYG